MDRGRKRRATTAERNARLQNIVGKHSITASALCDIVRCLQAQGIADDDVTTRKLREARDAAFEQVACSETLPDGDGGEVEWQLLDPATLVEHVLKACKSLASLYNDAHQRCPSTLDKPWSAIVAYDEFAPGNVLKPDNQRKTMNVRVNFRELGLKVLQHSHTWFCIASVRRSLINEVEGGWSRMLAVLLRRMFLGPRSFLSGGLLVVRNDQTFIVFAQLANVLSDLDGIRIGLDLKAPGSARKACFIHYNVFRKDDEVVEQDPANYVTMSCCDQKKFKKQTSQDLYDSMDILIEASRQVEAKTMTKARFEQMQKAMGLKCNPQGLLAQRDLRDCIGVLEVITLDWMHLTICDGIFTTEFRLFLQACHSEWGLKLSDFNALFYADWSFPRFQKGKSKIIHHIFTPARETALQEKDKLKFFASEILGSYSILRFFVSRHCKNYKHLVHKEWESFMAAADIIDYILEMKRGAAQITEATCDRLLSKIARHLRKHIDCFGDEFVRSEKPFYVRLGGSIP